MKHIYSAFLASALALVLVAPTAARERMHKANEPRKAIVIPDNARRGDNGTRLDILRSQVTTEDIVISEDFEYFEEGTNDAPDQTYLLASSVYEPGIFIDPDLTKQPGWWGDWVYSAGGAAALMCPDYNNLGYIATPMGDYSGEVTVTLRAKALPCGITGTSIYVAPYIDCGATYPTYAETDGSVDDCEVRLYPDQGWTRISYTFKNYSANPDGAIIISASGWALIDDVEVSIKPTFIAEPVVKELTDITPDGFSINWNPVRKSFNYWIDLYEKVYTGTGDTTKSLDFENGLPGEEEGWTFSLTGENPISDTEGYDGSKGLILLEGDSYASPEGSAAMKNYVFWPRAINPEGSSKVDGYIYFDVMKDGEWEQYGYYDLYWFTGSDDYNFIDFGYEDSSFAEQYTALRVRVKGLSEGTYVIIDEVEVTYAPSFEMVEQENPDDEEGAYGYFYATVDRDAPLTYHFSNLKPEGEYYYRVRSHYVSTFSDSKLHHAFFVADPEALPATEIAEDCYTANWTAVPKATSYLINSYGRDSIAEAGWYALLDEDFSKITDDYTDVTDPYQAEALWNYPACGLDEFTQQPGWTGLLNTIAVGMLGCEDAQWMTTYITTPVIDLSNSQAMRLRLKAYGYDGSGLIVKGGGKTYLINYESDGSGDTGILDGYVDLEITGRTTLQFYDYGMAPFIFDEIQVIQYLEPGAMVYTLLDTYEVDAPATSLKIEGLDKDAFTDYAFDVTAKYAMDSKTVTTSNSSSPVWVNLRSGETGGLESVAMGVEVATEVARYSIDGRRLARPTKGINIVVFSNGKVVKEVVR